MAARGAKSTQSLLAKCRRPARRLGATAAWRWRRIALAAGGEQQRSAIFAGRVRVAANRENRGMTSTCTGIVYVVIFRPFWRDGPAAFCDFGNPIGAICYGIIRLYRHRLARCRLHYGGSRVAQCSDIFTAAPAPLPLDKHNFFIKVGWVALSNAVGGRLC